MKKQRILSWALILLALFALTGCGGVPDGPESSGKAERTENGTASGNPVDAGNGTEAEETSGRALVVYFSRTGEQYTVGVIDKGNTAIVAEMIAEAAGADLFELLPADDRYPMTYDELTDVAMREQNENARPEYAGDLPDLAAYDTIFIGAPVWWGDWPMILYTFFENNAEVLSGKTLVPFVGDGNPAPLFRETHRTSFRKRRDRFLLQANRAA